VAKLDITLSRIVKGDKLSLIRCLNERGIYDNTLLIPYPYTEKDADWWLNHVTHFERSHLKQKVWAIRNAKEELIGAVGLQFKYGLHSHKDEFGYWLAQPYWGQGIMTEAIKTFTEICFTKLRLIRLEATVFHFNQASCRVLEKTGFEYEGLLRKFHEKDGKIFDGLLYAKTHS
jgi:[ribosomal protein S5]-alanine N-acetyltransferase